MHPPLVDRTMQGIPCADNLSHLHGTCHLRMSDPKQLWDGAETHPPMANDLPFDDALRHSMHSQGNANICLTSVAIHFPEIRQTFNIPGAPIPFLTSCYTLPRCYRAALLARSHAFVASLPGDADFPYCISRPDTTGFFWQYVAFTTALAVGLCGFLIAEVVLFRNGQRLIYGISFGAYLVAMLVSSERSHARLATSNSPAILTFCFLELFSQEILLWTLMPGQVPHSMSLLGRSMMSNSGVRQPEVSFSCCGPTKYLALPTLHVFSQLLLGRCSSADGCGSCRRPGRPSSTTSVMQRGQIRKPTFWAPSRTSPS